MHVYPYNSKNKTSWIHCEIVSFQIDFHSVKICLDNRRSSFPAKGYGKRINLYIFIYFHWLRTLVNYINKLCCFCAIVNSLDGRRANELRRIRYKLGVFSHPDGSAYYEQGNTKVLVAVYGPHKVWWYLYNKYICIENVLIFNFFSLVPICTGKQSETEQSWRCAKLSVQHGHIFD